MPLEPPVTSTDAPSNCFIAATAAGAEAGAELGISSQPMRERDSVVPSSAFEEAWPRRSRSAIFSSPYRRVGLSAGRPSISSRIRARSW